ncbi:hypothetical protein EJ02DRAFT_453720 [Clathrospora elynae]|uniref:Secreted protein n=1 Tax=Clathrospora elynae TaxID=706981 RepID=A0A6A5SQS9_9PLEO|nr:hypothetical protein EJ02DRAFT_453720 [Clathrospora elynae]
MLLSLFQPRFCFLSSLLLSRVHLFDHCSTAIVARPTISWRNPFHLHYKNLRWPSDRSSAEHQLTFPLVEPASDLILATLPIQQPT